MQHITTVVTGVASGDTDGALRVRQLADRDADLAAHARAGYVLHSTQTITGGDRVTFVDTLTRTE
jgi:hypothetical protein